MESKTDYLWREVLTRTSLTNILENYAQVVESKDAKTDRKKRDQVWAALPPTSRWWRRLLLTPGRHGAGKRYLIQHSAGSGKSYSITWLAHQLIRLRRTAPRPSTRIIVVTEPRHPRPADPRHDQGICPGALDGGTRGAFRRLAAVHRIQAGRSSFRRSRSSPSFSTEIGTEHRGRLFAIIIDEAHSSQGGRTSTAISRALSATGDEDEEDTFEDQINRLMESHKLLANASYFAFTATPKNKTLELFGEPGPQSDGTVQHHAFHTYSMKQAIQEGFILDVLAHYTPVKSYYKLAKTVEDDPEFDAKKAKKKLWRFVEGHEHAIRLKAEIMVDHFHDQVVNKNKIGGAARAMVVTNGVERAIQYFHSIRDYLKEHVRAPIRLLWPSRASRNTAERRSARHH